MRVPKHTRQVLLTLQCYLAGASEQAQELRGSDPVVREALCNSESYIHGQSCAQCCYTYSAPTQPVGSVIPLATTSESLSLTSCNE